MKLLPIAFILTSCLSGYYFLFAVHNNEILNAFFWHLLTTSIGVVGMRLMRADKKIPLFETVSCFFVPFLGTFFALYYSCLDMSKIKAGVLDDYQEHIAGQSNFANKKTAFFDPQPERLQSLSIILQSDSPLLEKRTAIEALAQLETPKSVAILRKALYLDSVEMRFFAASTLSSLEVKLTDSLKKREAYASREGATDEDFFNIAQSYFDFSYYKIAEGEREKKYLKLAKKYLDRITIDIFNNKIYELKGRICLALGLNNEALSVFKKNIESKPTQQSLLWCAEASYCAHQFTQTINYCKKAKDLGPIPLRIRKNIDFWLESA